ncbi:hypothetical protein OV208_20920 [Corallococcus sp. bb12-1]|uniref:hypothetical protein n=1 Tax=Corallococcus sp. bb12-1 TaxID=2996784 RepID=UPI0022703CF0|nr:hypothetical protein [Corallococcus sp. bb12-1]MCY1043795.1 hypothetical protein [Corallococcus sp. bb12-1]
MTSSEVRDLYPDLTALNSGAFFARTEVARMPAVVTFGFLGDRLVAVEVELPEVTDLKGSERLLRDLLTQKYGPPVRVRDTDEEARRRAGAYRTAAEVTHALGHPVSSDSASPQDASEQAAGEDPEAPPEVAAGDEAQAVRRNHKPWIRFRTVESHVKLSMAKSRGASSMVIEYESARYGDDIRRARALGREGLLKDL